MPVDALKLVQSVAFSALPNYLESIDKSADLLSQRGINTPLRLAHFFAQALLETGGFTIRRESMNYSAPRLMEIFGLTGIPRRSPTSKPLPLLTTNKLLPSVSMAWATHPRPRSLATIKPATASCIAAMACCK